MTTRQMNFIRQLAGERKLPTTTISQPGYEDNAAHKAAYVTRLLTDG